MQQASNRDNSVQFSLKELRELETRRVEDELARRRDADAARAKAIADDAAAKVAAIEAQLAAERDEAVRIEAARAEAARQERMALEAHEAAERARHQAELEATRMREEMDIRRIEANKKRPKWMLAVTVLATLATGVLIWFTVQAVNSSAASTKEAQIATVERDQAIAAQKAAAAELDKMQADLVDLDATITATTQKLIDANSKAERDRLAADLKSERERKAKIQQAIDDARRKKEHDDRIHGVDTSKLCVGQSVCRDQK